MSWFGGEGFNTKCAFLTCDVYDHYVYHKHILKPTFGMADYFLSDFSLNNLFR